MTLTPDALIEGPALMGADWDSDGLFVLVSLMNVDAAELRCNATEREMGLLPIPMNIMSERSGHEMRPLRRNQDAKNEIM